MLIGREREQKTIDQLVAGARIGASGVLALTGEPGVGKSALLRWAEERLDGFRVLRATGTEPERDVPFAGLLGVLRPALHLLDTIAPPQAEALAGALALRPGSAGDRFTVGAGTLSLLCRYAEEAPVAVVLDDVHLLDRPSATALVFAARRLSSDPIAVLLAAREGEADDLVDGFEHLALSGLELGAARSLVFSLTPTPVTDDWLTRVLDLTGGNPLAITELAADPDALVHAGPAVPPPLSAALTASFARRVSTLPSDVRTVLLVAVACNGDLRLTGEVCSLLDVDLALLGEAQHVGLADVVGGAITFRHPLLRAAIYSGSTSEDRRAVHAAAARALPDDDVDRRAWHLSESRWAPDAEVADLLTAAANRAVERSAYAVASTALERAARLSPGTDDLAARLVAAAEHAWAAGTGSRALALLDELQPTGLAPELATGALELRAAIAIRTGSVQEGAALLERAAAETTSADVRALLLAEAAHASFLVADGTGGLRLAEQLTAAVASATSPRARAVGMLATGMARVMAGTGGIDELVAAVPLLAGVTDLRSDDRGVWWLMNAPLFMRDADTGRGLRARVDAARERAGVGTLPTLLFLVGRDQATSDAWARAAADYTEAIRLARDTGQTTELAMASAGLAALEARTGREAKCRAHAAEALSLCRSRGLHWAEAVTLLGLGELDLARGDPASATRHLREVERLLGDRGVGDPDLSPRPELVEALLRLGRSDEAAPLAAAHLAAAEAKGLPWSRARARRCLGLVTDDFDASFLAALDLHAETPDVFETARTTLAYGARLRRAGRRVEAREHLRRALAQFGDLGAEPWADQAATELDLTGERVPRRALGGIAALTPQELQVALLLADGRTTREAAAALFLSPKTVEYHLRKVYARLGIRSRDELAALVPAE